MGPTPTSGLPGPGPPVEYDPHVTGSERDRISVRSSTPLILQPLDKAQRDTTMALPTLMPGAALPDAEELLDGLAVQVAGVHAAEHAENFRKSLKPHKLGKHRKALLLRHVRERTGII